MISLETYSFILVVFCFLSFFLGLMIMYFLMRNKQIEQMEELGFDVKSVKKEEQFKLNKVPRIEDIGSFGKMVLTRNREPEKSITGWGEQSGGVLS